MTRYSVKELNGMHCIYDNCSGYYVGSNYYNEDIAKEVCDKLNASRDLLVYSIR